MNKVNIATILAVPLVLAILLGSVEVFNLRHMLDSRKRVDEYQKAQEEAATLELVQNYTKVVEQLLMNANVLERKMSLANESTKAEILRFEQRLTSLLALMNGILNPGGSNATVESVEKNLELDGCVKKSVTCSTISQYMNPKFNVTFSECLTGPQPTLDGEIVGTSTTGSERNVFLGRVVHRDCTMETPNLSIGAFEAIPATGSSLVFENQNWNCRCYGISNGTASLPPFLCRLTVTFCNEGARFVEVDRARK